MTEDALVRHIAKNHTKPIAQKFRCELCDFVTTKKTELSKHLQKSHRGSKVIAHFFLNNGLPLNSRYEIEITLRGKIGDIK